MFDEKTNLFYIQGFEYESCLPLGVTGNVLVLKNSSSFKIHYFIAASFGGEKFELLQFVYVFDVMQE